MFHTPSSVYRSRHRGRGFMTAKKFITVILKRDWQACPKRVWPSVTTPSFSPYPQPRREVTNRLCYAECCPNRAKIDGQQGRGSQARRPLRGNWPPVPRDTPALNTATAAD
jgi:hypothetical protein